MWTYTEWCEELLSSYKKEDSDSSEEYVEEERFSIQTIIHIYDVYGLVKYRVLEDVTLLQNKHKYTIKNMVISYKSL